MAPASTALFIPIVGILMPMVLVPTILVLRFVHRRHEWRHRERMRALELGRPIPPPDRGWPALVAIALGAGVPIGTFGFAWLTALTSGRAGEDVFIPATVVSCVALGIGAKLALRLLPAREPADDPAGLTKPALDPDAYDVAGRRG